MTTDLTMTSRTAADRYSPPALTTSLAALVTDDALWRDFEGRLPALSADERASAEDALVAYDAMPKGCEPDRIAKLIGSISWMPTKDGGADQARIQLKVYQSTLADIDGDVLAAAVREAVKTVKFLPTVAELRQIAMRLPAPDRVQRAWRLRQLLAVEPADEPAADVTTTDEEVASWPPSYRRTALNKGWITQAQFDAARAADDAQAIDQAA